MTPQNSMRGNHRDKMLKIWTITFKILDKYIYQFKKNIFGEQNRYVTPQHSVGLIVTGDVRKQYTAFPRHPYRRLFSLVQSCTKLYKLNSGMGKKEQNIADIWRKVDVCVASV